MTSVPFVVEAPSLVFGSDQTPTQPANQLKKPNTLVVTIPGMISEADLAPLREKSDVTYAEMERIAEAALASRCAGFDYLMLNMDVVPKKGALKLTSEFYSHPGTADLRSVAVDMTGMDYFSPKLAAARGLMLQNIPHYSSQSVAESAVAEVLLHSRQRHLAYMDEIRGRKVEARKGINLSGRTAGVVGFGSIGSTVAQLLRGLGMTVRCWNRTRRPGVDDISLEQLFSDASVIVLAVKTVSEGQNLNIGMIGSALLARCKGSIVVNLANPLLVDAEAMKAALVDGRVAGYSVETSDRASLGNDERVHFPPSNAWDSDESMATLRSTWVENILSAIAGSPKNVYAD